VQKKKPSNFRIEFFTTAFFLPLPYLPQDKIRKFNSFPDLGGGYQNLKCAITFDGIMNVSPRIKFPKKVPCIAAGNLRLHYRSYKFDVYITDYIRNGLS